MKRTSSTAHQFHADSSPGLLNRNTLKNQGWTEIRSCKAREPTVGFRIFRKNDEGSRPDLG
jgi:hypothetical protein